MAVGMELASAGLVAGRSELVGCATSPIGTGTVPDGGREG